MKAIKCDKCGNFVCEQPQHTMLLDQRYYDICDECNKELLVWIGADKESRNKYLQKAMKEFCDRWYQNHRDIQEDGVES